MTHLGSTKNPMSEARRQHVHGPIRTMAQQAREVGELTLLQGAAVFAAGLGVLIAAVLFVSALREPPAAQASVPSAARISHTSAAEAGAGNGEPR